LSGPLLDRIDLHVHVPAVDVQALSQPSASSGPGEVSALRERVALARAMQKERHAHGLTSAPSNAQLSLSELRRVGRPSSEGERLLTAAAEVMGISARAYVRILRVARTIADLESSQRVEAVHVSEAVRCRVLDQTSLASSTDH
jgi:magnesium chelatase family protein